ncbi:queuosine precursor transporter [bacterium]|nr:queuosine precursor transporter [bacterium]
MLNEVLFLCHALVVGGTALGALGLGRCALITFVALQWVVANLFVTKQTVLFGLTVTCADVFIVGAVFSVNLLQEFFGSDAARKAIWIGFASSIWFLVMSIIHVSYAQCDAMHCHFAEVLQHTPRVIIASLFVMLFVQLIERRIYAWLKRAFWGRLPVMRNIVSLTFCQGLDTVLFTFAGLYGIVNSVWHIIAMSFVVKLAAILLVSPVVKVAKFFVSTSK